MHLRRGPELVTVAGGRSPAFTVTMTLFACLLVYFATSNIGTVMRAATADGRPGVFVPGELSCIRHAGGHESCVWIGEFRSDDGTVRRSGVEMYGSDRATHQAGRPARALDVGSAARVYGPDGSNEWVVTALMLASAAAIVWFLYGNARRGVRRPQAAARD